MIKTILLPAAAIAIALPPGAALAAGERLAVHEWGTFTSLQDEDGKPIGGVNTEDEPVPPFVHWLGGYLLIEPIQLPPSWFQGAPACHPDVTMRLETPVIYFHLPEGSKEPATLDVDVAFRGGWLTQYFPLAKAAAPGISENVQPFGPIRPETTGTLAWRGLRVGTRQPGPETKERVWLSPRAVEAADVTTPEGESERFLFYRGVGCSEPPLSVSRDAKGDRLQIRGRHDLLQVRGRPLDGLKTPVPLRIEALWLADIRPGGSAAFRALEPVEVTADADRVLATAQASFERGEHSKENLAKLRDAMRAALEKEGLFADEAAALLNTWELSYFQSAGLRLFFLVPRRWTDHVLPLRISRPVDVVRVMVGRIELVTPAQRRLLAEIAEERSSGGGGWWPRLRGAGEELKLWRELESGKTTPGSLRERGIEIPEDYRRYIELGRFRNALVLDEAARRPGRIQAFIRAYGLEPRAVARTPGGDPRR